MRWRYRTQIEAGQLAVVKQASDPALVPDELVPGEADSRRNPPRKIRLFRFSVPEVDEETSNEPSRMFLPIVPALPASMRVK